MHFIHKPAQDQETIAAIATPPGEGGVAIIRVSGTEAITTVSQIFSGPLATYPSHTLRMGKIIDLQGDLVDEVMIAVMRAPRSYTGEETVEIHCHGGSLVSKRVLDTVLQAGARTAQPGEFTYRAFVNGKLDLAQAEAVQELIHARNTAALKVAEQHLQGDLSKKISNFQHALTDIAAILEAWVDFPEEGLEFASMEEVIHSLEGTCREMERLAATFEEGKIVKEGLTLCLAGPPNVGKSSLLNALLGKERAIVTPHAGTTRDLLEEDVALCGLRLHLTDTAGIRETEESIEQEGIRRSRAAVATADLVLLVLDATQEMCASTQSLLTTLSPHKTLLVWNKIDLPHHDLPPLDPFPSVRISAQERRGLEELKQALHHLIWHRGPPSKEEVILTSCRHHEALVRAIAALRALITGLQTGVSAEFLTFEMRTALQELGTIIGQNITEEILSAIFSKFCVGK